MLLAIVLTAAGVGLWQYSGLLRVKNVLVERSALDLPLAEIEKVVRAKVGQQLIFLVDKTELEQTVQKLRPDIQRVLVTRQYPATLKITLFKFPVVAALRRGPDTIFIDASGRRVAGGAPTPDTFTLFVPGSLPVGDPTAVLVPPANLAAMQTAAEQFTDETGLPVVAVRYLPTARETRLQLASKIEIWLDLTRPVVPQIAKLTAAGKNLPWKDVKKYVDLRVRNKIFYQ